MCDKQAHISSYAPCRRLLQFCHVYISTNYLFQASEQASVMSILCHGLISEMSSNLPCGWTQHTIQPPRNWWWSQLPSDGIERSSSGRLKIMTVVRTLKCTFEVIHLKAEDLLLWRSMTLDLQRLMTSIKFDCMPSISYSDRAAMQDNTTESQEPPRRRPPPGRHELRKRRE